MQPHPKLNNAYKHIARLTQQTTTQTRATIPKPHIKNIPQMRAHMPFILCREMKYARASGVTISGWQLLKVSGPRGEAMASVRVPAFVCFSLRSVSLIYPLILLFFNFFNLLKVRFLLFFLLEDIRL